MSLLPQAPFTAPAKETPSLEKDYLVVQWLQSISSVSRLDRHVRNFIESQPINHRACVKTYSLKCQVRDYKSRVNSIVHEALTGSSSPDMDRLKRDLQIHYNNEYPAILRNFTVLGEAMSRMESFEDSYQPSIDSLIEQLHPADPLETSTKKQLDQLRNHSSFTNFAYNTSLVHSNKLVSEEESKKDTRLTITVETKHPIILKHIMPAGALPTDLDVPFSYNFGRIRFGIYIDLNYRPYKGEAFLWPVTEDLLLKEEYGHPHPHATPGGAICLGAGEEPFYEAIKSTNLLEAFEILFSIIKTYNHVGAYEGGLTKIYESAAKCSSCHTAFQSGTPYHKCTYSLKRLHIPYHSLAFHSCSQIDELTRQPMSPQMRVTWNSCKLPLSKLNQDNMRVPCTPNITDIPPSYLTPNT